MKCNKIFKGWSIGRKNIGNIDIVNLQIVIIYVNKNYYVFANIFQNKNVFIVPSLPPTVASLATALNAETC